MSISTLAGVNTGLQSARRIVKGVVAQSTGGGKASSWFKAGAPAAGVADTSTAGGVARSSTSALVAGQIPHYDPGSGNAYLAFCSCSVGGGTSGAQTGIAYLFDRLWDCGATNLGVALSPTLLTAQTVNSAAWPTRDESGTANGVGVYVALEISTALGGGTSGWSISYTNSAGSSGLTGTNTQAQSQNGVGNFYIFGIAGGDKGVKSVQSVTNAATDTSGQYVLVAFRMLAVLDFQSSSGASAIDAVTGGFVQIQNGCVPFIALTSSFNGTAALNAIYQEAQG